MKPPSAYGYVLSDEVFAVLLGLSKRQQRRLAAEFERLARHPNASGRYNEKDAEGHTIQFHLDRGWWIGCWVDHAVREVRVVQLVEP